MHRPSRSPIADADDTQVNRPRDELVDLKSVTEAVPDPFDEDTIELDTPPAG